jgi:decaprenylphospho-beta-D-erythro-pentofuranosid-2-ulose 2-reductase
VECVEWDARDVARHERVLGRLFDADDIDVVVLTVGVLGDQAAVESDVEELRRVIDTNFTGCAAALTAVAGCLRRQGHGMVAVLSTIAATQARRSNFGYGASKAGLDAFALGTGDALAGSGARVLVVRPGFVRTTMTAGMDEAPFSCDAGDVGEAISAALDHRNRAVVYVPGPVRFVSWLLRVLPRALVRRLPR